MAKIHEETIQIKLSKLVKESAKTDKIVSAELVENLSQVIEQLAPEGVIVEVVNK